MGDQEGDFVFKELGMDVNPVFWFWGVYIEFIKKY